MPVLDFSVTPPETMNVMSSALPACTKRDMLGRNEHQLAREGVAVRQVHRNVVRQSEHLDILAGHEAEGLGLRRRKQRHQHGGVETLLVADEGFEEVLRGTVQETHERQAVQKASRIQVVPRGPSVRTFDPSAPTSVISPTVIANPTPGTFTGIQLSIAVTIE
ncbi:MAG: hypothetical protein U5K74_02110 [Gemmatimonadaceae bacterium]|nr:hypothetical protein [Gemmatimonadaceae bacterium]